MLVVSDAGLFAVAQYKRICDRMGEQYGVACPNDAFRYLLYDIYKVVRRIID